MRAGEAGGWEPGVVAVAGVEEREVKHEAVLLQASKKPILRVGCAWAKVGVLGPSKASVLAAASGAASEEVVTRLCSSRRGAAGDLLVEILC